MDYPLRLAEQLRAHLRALRKQRGLTQAQLGQRLGVGQARVAEIEAKPGLVSADQLIKLLSVLGATLVLRDRAAPDKAPSQYEPDTAKARRSKRATVPAPDQKAVEAAPSRAAGRKTAGRAAKAPAHAIAPKKGSW